MSAEPPGKRHPIRVGDPELGLKSVFRDAVADIEEKIRRPAVATASIVDGQLELPGHGIFRLLRHAPRSVVAEAVDLGVGL